MPNPLSSSLEASTLSRARNLPFGAQVAEDGSVCFRLFAPAVSTVKLELEGVASPLLMEPQGDGWFELTPAAAQTGSSYRFVLPDGLRVPDPASRFQSEDVAGPSEVIDPRAYRWSDGEWYGRPWNEAVLYELHIGAFTPDGNFLSAIAKLDHLAALGVTAIELMGIADFPGLHSWGYDGVLLYAPDSAYGRPEDLKAFADAAHARGLMVILDVVYNHFGPEGNYLNSYFPQIESAEHSTAWGAGLNFDGEHSKEVRSFLIENALYWIEEFHLDGLRLDASHAMVDNSPKHVLDELADRVRELAAAGVPARHVHLILENEDNTAHRLKRDPDGRSEDFTAQWNHDTSHLLGAAMSSLCERPEDDGGETEKIAEALAEGFVISLHEHAGAGDPKRADQCPVPPTAYIGFIQTHDLIGNRVFGERIGALAPAHAIRAVAATYLLLPQIPMLFMGEEWNATAPFPYFCDYHGELAEQVRKGRCEQLTKQGVSEDDLRRAPDPQSAETFRSAQLRWDEAREGEHAAMLDWYTRVLAVRRESIAPLLRDLHTRCGSYQVLEPGVFCLEWTLAGDAKLHLTANLCAAPATRGCRQPGRELWVEGWMDEEGKLGPWSVRWSLEGA